MGAGIGVATAVVGGTIGKTVTKGLGGLVINGIDIKSPLVEAGVKGAVGGAIGGYTTGFTMGLLFGEDVKGAHSQGLNGLSSGVITGTAAGVASGFNYARQNNISPWTGNELGTTAAKGGTNVLSKGEFLRIENAATRINEPINVVGSRATGKAGAYSDWDYVSYR